jgi:hypothetical protein
VKMREQLTNCQRFDNTPGTRKRRATELFNERHGLSALFCSGFLARCRLNASYSTCQKVRSLDPASKTQNHPLKTGYKRARWRSVASQVRKSGRGAPSFGGLTCLPGIWVTRKVLKLGRPAERDFVEEKGI